MMILKLIRNTWQAAMSWQNWIWHICQVSKTSKTAVVLIAGVTISGTPCFQHITVPFGATEPSGLSNPTSFLRPALPMAPTTTPEMNEVSSAWTQRHSYDISRFIWWQFMLLYELYCSFMVVVHLWECWSKFLVVGCPSSHQPTRIMEEKLESGNLFNGSWISAFVPIPLAPESWMNWFVFLWPRTYRSVDAVQSNIRLGM